MSTLRLLSSPPPSILVPLLTPPLFLPAQIPKGRPVALSFNPDANLLYVSSAVEKAVSTFSLNVN